MPTTLARTGAAAAPILVPATADTTSDDALIARIASGDRAAMRLLFARHQTAVYRWLLRLVGDEPLVEDLLNDVFLDVWRQAGAFAGRSSVSTWLLAIARHKAISSQRRRRDDQLDAEIAESIPDTAANAEMELEERDRSRQLAAALRHLSGEHRAVIDLVYYHGRTVNEVAAILGVPAATVKTRMFYARRKLAQFVQH
jgi:RNA polymerase sigma-70 factor (ECF subfamily)